MNIRESFVSLAGPGRIKRLVLEREEEELSIVFDISPEGTANTIEVRCVGASDVRLHEERTALNQSVLLIAEELPSGGLAGARFRVKDHKEEVISFACREVTTSASRSVRSARPEEGAWRWVLSSLGELQEWYAAECDGHWERNSRIRIESIDNPGWILRVDLTGTRLENREFAPHATDHTNRWVDMRLANGIWQAACDPTGLEAAIQHFLDWARPVHEDKG